MRVETEQGIVGWGEGTLEGHTEAIEGAYKDLAERFIGWDSDQIQNIWQHAYRSRFYRGGPVLMVSYLLNDRMEGSTHMQLSISRSVRPLRPRYRALGH